MALSQRLSIKQSQSLVMTPQLVQSIKLLQLGSAELAKFVREEIEKNPLLVLDPEPNDASRRENQTEAGGNSKPKSDKNDGIADSSELVSESMPIDANQHEDSIDASFENVYDKDATGVDNKSKDYSADAGDTSSRNQWLEDNDVVARLGETQSLAQFLETQLACEFSDPQMRKIARYITHALDDDGYFREDIRETATSLGVDAELVLSTLKRFQQFEPAGIGARDLAECLSIQLKDKNRFDPAMQTLIDNLDLLARREFKRLMKCCNVCEEDLHDMMFEIKELDPRPAARYEPVLSQIIIPDVLIKQKNDGAWFIELNAETLPRVLVNNEYYTELNTLVTEGEGREFISECFSTANWLVKSLDQRAQTILKVATEIVKQQDMFFAKGIEYLKPLNLKAIARAIKMHESTVSRVTNNKFLMCDQGIFELKYFFSTAIATKDGEDPHSAEVIRHKIRQLIDDESANKILSDDQIVTKLQDTGIDIARRTIAKYREAMKIPSSVQRRREKKHAIK